MIGLAALAGLILWLKYQPQPPADPTEKGVGETLCPGFTDESLPHHLTIVRPKSEKETVEAVEIRLERGKEGWQIETADDAPADSPDRMTMVLAPLLRLTVLSDIREINTHSDESAILEFHRSCGLLDPTTASASEMSDAGIRLTVTGGEGETFADLIIGRVPEGSSEVRDIRYVRLAGEDAVFTVDFSGEELEGAGKEKAPPYIDRLSIDPIDWMNRDLLRVSRWNITRMTLFEIAIDDKGKLTPHKVKTAAQDPDRSLGRVWELLRQTDFDENGKPVEVEITDENRFPDSAPFNQRAEQITHLRFGGLLRLPTEIAQLATIGRPVREWTPFAELLNPLGFRFADHDPTDPDAIEPLLLGAEGTASLTMNDGIRLTILFGAETSDGQAILVLPALDEESLPKPEPVIPPEGATPEEAKRIADENRLRENEYALNRSEAEVKLRFYRNRFSDWVFLLGNE